MRVVAGHAALVAVLGLAIADAGAEPVVGPPDTPAIESETEVEDRPDRVRAGIEVALTLGVATVRYQLDGKRKKNWDFPSFEARVSLEAWRYDNNPFGINNLWHAVEGTAFHLIARSNDMSLLESAALGFGSSFAWEFLFEFKEKVSINDVLFTPTSGMAAGEFLHWLGRYLDSAGPSPGAGVQAARWTLGFPYALHRRLDGRKSPLLSERRDNLGLRADIWHRFEVSAAAAMATGEAGGEEIPGSLASMRAAGRLVAIDGYRQPGEISRGFASGNMTEASYELTLGGGGTGSRFRAESILVGRYNQQIDEDGGHGWTAGVALSYDWRREQLARWQDRLALLHLPGLAVDGELHGRHTTWSTRARLHGDFASVHAINNQRYLMEHADQVGKTILRKQGYYFGWGGSARVETELESRWPRPLSVGAALLVGHYNSDESLDRTQETVTHEERLSDTVLELDGWLRFQPIDAGPHLELRLSHQHRSSDHEDLSATQRLTRFSAGFWLPF